MLLKGGAKAVVITSLELDNGGDLVLLGGNKKGKREREGGGEGEGIKMRYIIIVGEKVRLTYPKIPAPFTGTGDLFTALLLGWSEYGLQVKTHTR